MSLNVLNPVGGPDLTRRNKRSVLYLTTDPTANNEDDAASDAAANGTIRLVFTPGDKNPSIQKKLAGVWNGTGVRFSSSSIELGRHTTISSVAGFLETVDLSSVIGRQKSFLPHTEVIADGTTTFTHAPSMDVQKTFVVYSVAVSQKSGTTIGVGLGVTPARAVITSIHETGTVPASKRVTVKFYKGTSNAGVLFDEKVLPASQLPANTTLSIDYDLDLGFEGGQPVFQEFTSPAAFSLKTDSSDRVLTTHVGHELKELGMITENIIFDSNLGHVLDSDLNPVYANQY